jgi:hypothetical protein
MKIQCSCGAKYTIEVTPEMARQPVHFVCSSCGRDASDYVTSLVHRELAFAGIPTVAAAPQPAHAGGSMIAPPPPGYTAPPPPDYAAAVAAPIAVAAPVAGPGSVAAEPGPRLRVRLGSPAPPESAETPSVVEGEALPRCLKHGGEVAAERCYICSKPICPKCMELFGYLCSPLCKAKAEAQGIDVPVFEGQRSVVESKERRKTLLITVISGAAVALIIGVWIWYAFIGSTPHTAYAVRFSQGAGSGQTAVAGKEQLILLHGATLARHDMKQKKEVWSRYLVNKDEIEKQVAEGLNANKAAVAKAQSEDPDEVPAAADAQELRHELEEVEAAELQLRLVGQNIWVISPTKLTLFDWDTGQPSKEIALTNNFGSLVHRGNEVILLDGEGARQHATYINLETKESREEEVTGLPIIPTNTPSKADLAKAGGKVGAKGAQKSGGGGLPTLSGKDGGKALDPNKVAAQAQSLSIPGKMALPAVLANSLNNQRVLKELSDRPDKPSAGSRRRTAEEPFLLIPTPDGFMRFTAKLLEEKIVTRVAMKAPPAKSALDGPVNVTKTVDVANEILNEMQRNAGGDTIEEDESRYLVKLSSADGKNEWSAEVVGPPHLYPLKTVNVLAVNKKILVFDKQNKKLWEAPLTYNVAGGAEDADALDSGVGQGPCVERNNVLYVFDEGVLTAFDLATGNAQWRVPSVGITGLFFDDKDMLYVNTTDASPDRIKYSRQIDISEMPAGLLLKINPKDGKIVWKTAPPGPVTYVSGKFIYCVQSSGPMEEGGRDSIMGMTGMAGTKAFLRIKRLNPSNGKEMWEHYEGRGPIEVQFDKNTIRLVFKKEVEVLKFHSL